MRFLFVHQNMPGQYRELVQWLADKKEHEIVFITQSKKPPVFEGVKAIIYKPHHVADEKAYGLTRTWENTTGSGFGTAQAAKKGSHQISSLGMLAGVINFHQRDISRYTRHWFLRILL
jgi:hypothetical protein